MWTLTALAGSTGKSPRPNAPSFRQIFSAVPPTERNSSSMSFQELSDMVAHARMCLHAICVQMSISAGAASIASAVDHEQPAPRKPFSESHVVHRSAEVAQLVNELIPNAQTVHPVNDPSSSKAPIATYALLNIINSDGSSRTSN